MPSHAVRFLRAMCGLPKYTRTDRIVWSAASCRRCQPIVWSNQTAWLGTRSQVSVRDLNVGAGFETERAYLVGSKSPSLYFSITRRYASHHFASPALSTFSCSLRPRASRSSLSNNRICAANRPAAREEASRNGRRRRRGSRPAWRVVPAFTVTCCGVKLNWSMSTSGPAACADARKGGRHCQHSDRKRGRDAGVICKQCHNSGSHSALQRLVNDGETLLPTLEGDVGDAE